MNNNVTAEMSDVCRSLDFRETYMGTESVAVYFPQSRNTVIFDPIDTGILRVCREFGSIAEHQERIARSDRASRYNPCDIAARIRNLRANGFLVSPTEILSGLRSETKTVAPPRISAIGIPTRNRPGVLKRTLEAYACRERTFGRTTRIVVIDDSSTENFRKEVRDIAIAVQRQIGNELLYIGPQERNALAAALARNLGIPKATADFGIGLKESVVSMGSARNALFLAHVGQMFISSDDDVGVDVVPSPPESRGLALTTSKGNDYELELFRDRAEMLSRVEFQSFDLTSAHERLLGRRLADLVAMESAAVWNLKGLNAKRHPRFRPESQVLFTAPGIVGDIACDYPLIYFLLPNKFRKEWHESEADYRMAMANRQVLRRPRSNAIVDEAHCMSTQIGIDNREHLPPFPPVYRAEDTAFGEIINACVPNSCVGFLSCCVSHLPPDERTIPRDFAKRLGNPGVNELLALLVSAKTSECSFESTPDRIISLGNYLMQVGKLPIAEFVEYLRELRCVSAGTMVASFEAQLRQQQEQCSYLVGDIKEAIANLKGLLVKRWVSPHDYLGPENEGPSKVQQYVAHYAALLRVWPCILDWVRKQAPVELLARALG